MAMEVGCLISIDPSPADAWPSRGTGVARCTSSSIAGRPSWAARLRQSGAVDIVNPALNDYLVAHCAAPDQVLLDLAAETLASFGDAAGMQISPDEGAFLAVLVAMTGARNAVEVGVFTGYSSIWIARALPDDGRLLACDVSEEWTAVARRYWQRAGVADRIELRLAPAVETLRSLPAEPSVDFAFIDADKGSYPQYYEELARLTGDVAA
jgi:caffeoyl-CoA O-methyltransferase